MKFDLGISNAFADATSAAKRAAEQVVPGKASRKAVKEGVKTAFGSMSQAAQGLAALGRPAPPKPRPTATSPQAFHFEPYGSTHYPAPMRPAPRQAAPISPPARPAPTRPAPMRAAVGQAEAERLLGVLDARDLLASSMLSGISFYFDRSLFDKQLARAAQTGDFESVKLILVQARKALGTTIDRLRTQVDEATRSGRLGPEVTGAMEQLISKALEAGEQRISEFAHATSGAIKGARQAAAQARQADMETRARRRLGVPENGDLLSSSVLDRVAGSLDFAKFDRELSEATQTGSYTDIERTMSNRKLDLEDHESVQLDRIDRLIHEGRLEPEYGATMKNMVRTIFDAAQAQIDRFDRKIDRTTKEQLAELVSVSLEASHADLTRAKRRASLQFHPDKNRDNPEAATQKISAINAAWDNYNSRFEAAANR